MNQLELDAARSGVFKTTHAVWTIALAYHALQRRLRAYGPLRRTGPRSPTPWRSAQTPSRMRSACCSSR